MALIIKVIGNKDICMEEVNLYGKQVKDIKETIILVRNKVLELISIIRTNIMRVCGKMEDNMEMEV